MAAEKLTDRTLYSGSLANGDLIHVVDVSDTTQDPAGSSFKLQLSQLKSFLDTNIYNSDGVITANRTVDLDTFVLNFNDGTVAVKGENDLSSDFSFKALNASSNEIFAVRNDKRVGVNQNAPTAALSVKGNGATGATNTFSLENSASEINFNLKDNATMSFGDPSTYYDSHYYFWNRNKTITTTSVYFESTQVENGIYVKNGTKAGVGGKAINIEQLGLSGQPSYGVYASLTGAASINHGAYIDVRGGSAGSYGARIYATQGTAIDNIGVECNVGQNTGTNIGFRALNYVTADNSTTYGIYSELSGKGTPIGVVQTAGFFRVLNGNTDYAIKSDGKLNFANIPTSATGLVAGDIWNNSGVLTIV